MDDGAVMVNSIVRPQTAIPDDFGRGRDRQLLAATRVERDMLRAFNDGLEKRVAEQREQIEELQDKYRHALCVICALALVLVLVWVIWVAS